MKSSSESIIGFVQIIKRTVKITQAKIKFIKTQAKTISILQSIEIDAKLHFFFLSSSFWESSQNILTKPQNGIQFIVNFVQFLFSRRTFAFGGSQSQNSSTFTQLRIAER